MPMFSCQALVHSLFGPLDLTLEQEDIVALSGASGIGKSLFLRCLADLEPHTGQIQLDQKNQIDYLPPDWRKRVGLLPADAQWWRVFVGDHFKSSTIDNLQTLNFDQEVLNWRIDRLSSGEKQRLALLRLLQNQPKVLLLDEPTANLDPNMTFIVEKLLMDYAKDNNAAILWVTHDDQQINRVSNKHFEFTRSGLKI